MIRATRPGFATLVLLALASTTAPSARGQDSADPLSKILTDPDKLEELKKERLRPPIEFFRSQVMPNDVLPYIKANHWAMVGLEMRANHEDYEGSLQTRPVPLADQPHEMIYRRDARLVKAQRSRLTMPIFLPAIPKELPFQLIRPEAIRQDEEWTASLRVLEPHQQLVVVLSKAANDQFSRWSLFRATLPSAARRDDPLLLDKQRYYRLVLPQDVDKPLLSAHPLTWSAVSHVIWDGLAPETIGTGQQEAMVDWLHWGGQLVIVGGAGPAFAPLRESFLAPYLPAEPSGENVLRTGAELKALSEAYPPPGGMREPDDVAPSGSNVLEVWETFGRRYKPPAPIPTADKKPMFIAGLKPKPGATVIPLGGEGNPPLAVEWKVGRGRLVMLGVSLTDPDLLAWPGYDTMVRRVVLRRPEEHQVNPLAEDQYGAIVPPRFDPLVGNDLTTVRYLSRDLGAPTRQAVDEDGKAITGYSTTSVDLYTNEVPVGEWLDGAALPTLCRTVLEQASGIEIPGRDFVLKVILAYILTLVPLNYLICRYVLRRREWAWAVVPTLSLAFAVGVERAAAYDVGFDSSCDEIDLVETHGDYPKGHVSRFASLYATGRINFTISYPNDPTALALPLATGRSLRGEDVTLSSFQTQPIPALTGFMVQPRSLAMFRAEQMASLPGTIHLSPPGQGPRMVVNESGLDLKDVQVHELRPDKVLVGVRIGSLAAGASIPLGELGPLKPITAQTPGELDPRPFLDLIRERSVATRPEEVGELRLIAWAEKTLSGQAVDPPVDRLRGFTLVVAHLQASPLLDSASERYNVLALGPERPQFPLSKIVPDVNSLGRGFIPGTGRRRNAVPPAGGMPGAVMGGGAPGMAPMTTTAPAPVLPPAPTTPTAPSNAPETPRP